MFYLRDIRKYRCMTMKELGEKVGLTESAIGLYETEKRKPNYEMLLKLSEALSCSVEELLHGLNIDEQLNLPVEVMQEMPPMSAEEAFGDIIEENKKTLATKRLYKILKGATSEEIEQATKILEALRK